jgi:hypothetical protein
MAAAAAAKNKFNFQKLQPNIINSQNNANLSEKFNIYLSNLEQELNDLEYRNVSNLQFENGTTGLNLKLNSLQTLLFSFMDVLDIFKNSNKDDRILRIKNLFKKKIIDFSVFINKVSEKIMRNILIKNKMRLIYDLLRLQNQLHTLYESYKIFMKNSNVSFIKLIEKHNKNIRNKYNKSLLTK